MTTLELVEESVKNNPLPILGLGFDAIKYADTFLPYSVGFEIECLSGESSEFLVYQQEGFLNIPDIIECTYSRGDEIRFRIPKGLKGLICLYKISKRLKENFTMTKGSGIHYHIDMTSVWYLLNNSIVELNKDRILTELDTWEYKGDYNHRNLLFDSSHNWVRFQSVFKTAEFRIGEMTFDYDLLFKRMNHASMIIKAFNFDETEAKYDSARARLESLTRKEDKPKEMSMQDILNLTKSIITR